MIHNGYKNTYTFHKDGVKVTFGPSRKERTSEPSKGEGNVFLSIVDFELEVEEASQASSLVVMESNSFGNLLPSEILSFVGISRYCSRKIPSILYQ